MENVRISGTGSVAGGEYDEVRISGHGDVTGDIKANLVRVSGSCDFKGKVECNDFDVSGSCEVGTYIKAKTVTVSGHCEVEGDMSADSIGIYGHGEVEGDINADRIEVKGHGEFKNVYGDNVIMGHARNKIEANEIEATNIELYRAEVNRVSGDNVTILGVSDVKVIEFKESLTITKQLDYEKIVKIENGMEIEISEDKLETTEGISIVKGDGHSGLSRVGRKIMSITPLVCVAAFLVLGFVWDLWHPGWLVFLLIPIVHTILKIKTNKYYAIASIINMLVAFTYVAIGVIFGIWHPTWIMFFIIPISSILIEKKK